MPRMWLIAVCAPTEIAAPLSSLAVFGSPSEMKISELTSAFGNVPGVAGIVTIDCRSTSPSSPEPTVNSM